MTFYWEQLCASDLGGSYSILFRDVKHDVCKEAVIKLDQNGKPESEDVTFYFNGELQEFKTEEELAQEIQRRSGVNEEEWEQTLFDNRNGILETIWLNKKHGIIKEEIVSESGIDTSFTVVKTHQTYHTFEEAVLHS
jgi:hypothetical protein